MEVRPIVLSIGKESIVVRNGDSQRHSSEVVASRGWVSVDHQSRTRSSPSAAISPSVWLACARSAT